MAVKKTPASPGFTAAFTPQAAKAITKVKRKADSQKAQDVSNAMGNIPLPEMPDQTTPVNAVTPEEKANQDTPVDSQKALKAFLAQYDLADLADDTFMMLRKEQITAQTPIDIIGELLKDTEPYKKRFAGNVALAGAKKPTWSITDYLDLEKGYKAAMQGSGLPDTFYDSPADYANFISGDVSVREVQDRVNLGFKAVNEANPETIKAMKDLYGVEKNDLAAYFLDPERIRPKLVGSDYARQAQAARIASEAKLQAGIGLDATQAEGLFRNDVSAEDARRGFSTIKQSQELYSNLIGETGAITQEEQIAGTFGTNQAAAQRIAQRKRQRQAEFTTGGTFTTTQGGVSGLGSANK